MPRQNETVVAHAPAASDTTALRDGTVMRRVRSLGSARDGFREWHLQRTTAVALIPLGLYFVASMVRLASASQVTASQWLGSPVPALMTIFFLAALFAHAYVGLRSVLLDYVHSRAHLVCVQLLVHGGAIVLAAAGVLAVLKLFLAR